MIQLFSNYLLDRMVYALEPRDKHKKRLATPEKYQFLNCTSLDIPVELPIANSQLHAEIEAIKYSQDSHENPGKLEHQFDDEFNWAFKKLIKDDLFKVVYLQFSELNSVISKSHILFELSLE